MYPYNTNNNIDTNIDRTRKSIKATRREFPDPLDNITEGCPPPETTNNNGTNNNMNNSNTNNNNMNNNAGSNNAGSNNANNPDRVRENMAQIFSAAMSDEAMDAAKYDGLMNYLSDNGLNDLSEVAKSMYNEESKHLQLLRDMAREDGIQIREPGDVTVEFDYTPAGILENIYSEIQGARFYRDFANVLRNENMGNLEDIDELMSDEQNHAVLNNYIYLRLRKDKQQ